MRALGEKLSSHKSPWGRVQVDDATDFTTAKF
jgi:hypothetical protein